MPGVCGPAPPLPWPGQPIGDRAAISPPCCVILQPWRVSVLLRTGPVSAGNPLASPALPVSQAAQPVFRRRRSWKFRALEEALAGDLTYRAHRGRRPGREGSTKTTKTGNPALQCWWWVFATWPSWIGSCRRPPCCGPAVRSCEVPSVAPVMPRRTQPETGDETGGSGRSRSRSAAGAAPTPLNPGWQQRFPKQESTCTAVPATAPQCCWPQHPVVASSKRPASSRLADRGLANTRPTASTARGSHYVGGPPPPAEC